MFTTNNTLSQVCFVSISACNQLGNENMCAAIQLQNVPYSQNILLKYSIYFNINTGKKITAWLHG